jgi:PAS domain S-box-containing protein
MGDELDRIYNELTSKQGKAKVEPKAEPKAEEKETFFEFQMDLKGNFTWVQLEAAALIGYTKEEIEDISLWDVLSNREHERISQKLDVRRKGGDVEPYETVLMTKEGKELKIKVQTAPILKKGKVVGIRGRIRPI